MPRGGHNGAWIALPQNFFRSRWKRFYKRSYRWSSRGISVNGVNRPGPHDQAKGVYPDPMPELWRLQYSDVNYSDKLPRDQRQAGWEMFKRNEQKLFRPAERCEDPIGRDLILRSLDPGWRFRGGDSGLGRPELTTKDVISANLEADRENDNDGADQSRDRRQLARGNDFNALPSHIFYVMKARSSEKKHDDEKDLLRRLGSGVHRHFPRRLYELCEEKEIVWAPGQKLDAEKEEAAGGHGRFPRIDEQASLVDNLGLPEILRLRHKTKSRHHPKWARIQRQFDKWQAQYESRRVVVKAEQKARISIIKATAE
eukprot:TRINITY_DN7477_c0_g2_i1.p1 TRINITY_DN7477_c0_g2~~TRINITY_DN7477_c0_g2_i1.p1  ORF type:complete len:313 (-),score=54.44 TRINITY_DN7477_c0_g2_i1:54-992(-)